MISLSFVVVGMSERWPPEDLESLPENHRNTSTQAVSRQLGRTVRAVYSMAHQLGVAQPHFKVPVRSWTAEEDGIPLDLSGILRPGVLADELRRTTGSVHHRARRLISLRGIHRLSSFGTVPPAEGKTVQEPCRARNGRMLGRRPRRRGFDSTSAEACRERYNHHQEPRVGPSVKRLGPTFRVHTFMQGANVSATRSAA